MCFTSSLLLLLFSHSVLSDSVTPWTAVHQTSLSFISPRVCWYLCPLNWWCHPTISSSVAPFSSCPQSFPSSGSFPRSCLFASGGQSSGTSASVLPMNIQDWFIWGLTGLISLQSKGLSRVFSNTTVQKHQFLGALPSLWSNSHFHTWPLERPQPWHEDLCQQSTVFAFYLFFLNFILFFNFTIFYWFCHILKWICHRYTNVPHPAPSSLLPPRSPYHPSGSSQCTSPKHPVSCMEPGLENRFIHDTIHISMPFSQIIPPSPSPSPTESKRLSIHQCLFCCLVYRVIVTIFLNSIYMH